MAHYAEMLNTNQPDESTVTAPRLRPWEPMPACTKCGLQVGFGIPIIRRLVALYAGRVQSYGYCRGDHDSTVKVQMPLLGSSVDVPVECFGLFHDHIHLGCNRCGYRWLMECAPNPAGSFWRDFGAFTKWFFIVFGAVSLLFLLFADFIGYR